MATFITGATGFIGNRLIRELIENDEALHLLCRRQPLDGSLQHSNIHIFPGDIMDYNSVERAMNGCDKVFHLAGYARNWAASSNIYYDVNVRGTQHVLKAAKFVNIKKIVLTSTAMTIAPQNPVSPENLFLTDYARSKYQAEKAAEKYIHDGLPVVWVHPTRVFGPGFLTEANSVTKMIQQYLKGEFRVILGNGRAVGNYAYIHDVIQGYMLAMRNGKPGENYILGGENLNYNEFFSMIATISRKLYKMFHIPAAIAIAVASFEKMRAHVFKTHPLITPVWVKTFLMDWIYSSAKAEEELGLKITPFRDAMSETISWLGEVTG